MIYYRSAVLTTRCDNCYRDRRPGEEGWHSHPEGHPPTIMMVEDSPGNVRRGELPAQPVDYCGECAAKQGAAA